MNEADSGADLPALPDSTTEDRWLQAARGGDGAAYVEIIAVFQDRLYDYVARVTGDSAIAARVAALSLRRLAASGFILGESGRLATRLYTIARDLLASELPAGPAAESEPVRSAVALREVHGLSAEEAGQVLDRDPPAVSALLDVAHHGRPPAGAPDFPSDPAPSHAPPAPLPDAARNRITGLLTSAWPALPAAAALTTQVDATLAAVPPTGVAAGAFGAVGAEPAPGDATPDGPSAAASALPPTAAQPSTWPAETGAAGAAEVPGGDRPETPAAPAPPPGAPATEETSPPGGNSIPDDAAAQPASSGETGARPHDDTQATSTFAPYAGAVAGAAATAGRDPDWDDEATSRFEFPPREVRPDYPPARPDGEEWTGFLPPPPPPPEPPTGRGGLGPIGGPLLIGLLFGILVACGVLSFVVVQSGLLAAPPPTETPVSTPTGTATAEATGTSSATPTATATPSVSATASRTATVSPSPTQTNTATPTGTATPSPTATTTQTPTPVPPTQTATAPATATRPVTPAATGTPNGTTATPGTAPTPPNRVNGSLEVQPGQVTFGPDDTEYTIAVINRSVAPLGWQASAAVPWLAADPAGGILPSSSQDPLTIVLRRDQLPADVREGQVIITSDDGRIELPVIVTAR